MKKLSYSTLVLFALAGVLMVGCKGKEKLQKGETELNIPCSGSDYFTNKNHFRANSLGESSDLVVSKKKAMDNARAELAAAIESTVKTVTDNYVNSREFNNREDLEERFEQLNRTIVNQTLSGIKMICEKQVQTKQGGYRTYVAIELSASDIVQKYNENLSKDERLRIDYDYEKFKETFDKEMDKMGNR
ncbi:MAG: LPP20 family lipoprotein [Cyclobacteriaceae bacterium]|nr:LPP20 family lipoprotein [Cyclobacteriaceae bacterium]